MICGDGKRVVTVNLFTRTPNCILILLKQLSSWSVMILSIFSRLSGPQHCLWRCWQPDSAISVLNFYQQMSYIFAKHCTICVCREPVILRPRGYWPRDKNFGLAPRPWPRQVGLGLGLALVLLTWPRKCAIQCKIILIVSISRISLQHSLQRRG